MWKVYKRICPNGRIYIGITSRTLEERMCGGYPNNREFALAIIKYGKENIISEILEEHESYDDALEREEYYIKLFGSFNPTVFSAVGFFHCFNLFYLSLRCFLLYFYLI
jgi:predicted GIY-YIG superfamily endonuclease